MSEPERWIKRRTKELLGQWRTARFGLTELEAAEDWARERALLEAEVVRALNRAQPADPQAPSPERLSVTGDDFGTRDWTKPDHPIDGYSYSGCRCESCEALRLAAAPAPVAAAPGLDVATLALIYHQRVSGAHNNGDHDVPCDWCVLRAEQHVEAEQLADAALAPTPLAHPVSQAMADDHDRRQGR